MRVGMRIGFLAIGTLAILLIVGICSFLSVRDLIETNEMVSHTHRVLTLINSMLVSATETQATSRGYLITGQARYKELNATAATRTFETVATITSLTGKQELQQERLSKMEDLVHELVNFYADAIKAYDAGGFEPSAKLIRSGGGQHRMEEVKRLAEELSETETSLLATRVSESRKSADHTILTIIAGTLLAVAFVTLFSYLVTRSITDPINMLQRSSENMERGRFDAIELIQTNDEFKDLGASFRHFGKLLQENRESLANEKKKSEESKKLIAVLKDQLFRITDKIEELLSQARLLGSQFESEAAHLEAIGKIGTELTHSALKINETARNACQSLKSFDSSLIHLSSAQNELSRNLNSVEQKVKSASTGITELADRVAEFSDILATVDCISTELNLMSTNHARENPAGHAEKCSGELLSEQIKSLSERSRQEAVKLRQILFRAEKSASKAAIICDDAMLNIEKCSKDGSAIGEKAAQLSELISGSIGKLQELSDSSQIHLSEQIEMPEKLENLENAAKEQGDLIRDSEMRIEELKTISSSARQMLSNQSAS